VIGRAASFMGSDKIRYLIFINGRWRWRPTRAMRRAGFRLINLSVGLRVDGRPVPSAADVAQAVALNGDWDRHRRGEPATAVAEKACPRGSIGEAYRRVMAAREADRAARGIVWSNEQHSRDDWPRAWKWIEPLFGDCDPKTITHELLIGDPSRGITGLRPLVAAKVSESEAHRVIKVWRALWQKMALMGYCNAERDPAKMFSNPAPQPRQAVWREGEAVRLVECAIRTGYFGLAALLAVAWDTQLSPVDVRNLRENQRRRDPVGAWFSVSRAKTGRAALGTLSKRTDRLLAAYVGSLGADLAGPAHVFRNRSGQPYSKDTLGDDFRAVRQFCSEMGSFGSWPTSGVPAAPRH
jgi:hypothetical protein